MEKHNDLLQHRCSKLGNFEVISYKPKHLTLEILYSFASNSLLNICKLLHKLLPTNSYKIECKNSNSVFFYP